MKIKMEDRIINASSQEFPMRTFYGNVSPDSQKLERPCIKLFPDLRNGFNNESPDFFRMDSMKENQTGYKNPYLNVVKTLDRSLFYKNNQSCIDHINMINKIKSKKDLSQNPKIIKQLCFSTDINKLENKLHKESKITPYMFKTITSDFSNLEYLKKIKVLSGEYTPNHHYLTKNSFNLKKIHDNQISCTKINENDNSQYNQNIMHTTNNINDPNKNYNNGIFNNVEKNNQSDKSFTYNINVNDMERAIEKNHNFPHGINNNTLSNSQNKSQELKIGNIQYDANYNTNNLGLKQMISPKQSSVLRNINDYDIKEFTARDETRLFSFPKKEKKIYNCILDQPSVVTPGNFTFDKWGKFHENYVMMMDQEKPFNVKSELFTEYCEKNRYLLDLIKQERKKMVAEKNRKMIINSNTTIYDSGNTRKNKFFSTNVKKSWNMAQTSNGRLETKERSDKKNFNTKTKFNIKSGVF